MKMLTRLLSSIPLAVALGLSGCSDRPDANAAAKPLTPSPAQATPTPQHANAQPRSAEPTAKSGTVKSAQVAGAYSYIETDINGQIFWIATSATHVNPGDKIAWNNHAVMNNFTSKAMGKTFDSILFTDRISKPSTQPAEHNGGTVLQAMTSGGYSYIQVDRNGSDVWIAAPAMIIEKGQSITWSGGAPMRNFSSRTLNRTFDQILFVSAVQKNR